MIKYENSNFALIRLFIFDIKLLTKESKTFRVNIDDINT